MTRNNMVSARNLKTEERRRKAVSMKMAGIAAKDIAKELGVNVSMVHRYIRETTTASITDRCKDAEVMFEEQLRKLDKIEFDAEQEWERSKRNRERITTKSPIKDGGQETTQMIEGQTGDPRFLYIRVDVVKVRCDLLGLNAPMKVEAKTETTNNVNVNISMVENLSESELLEYLSECKDILDCQIAGNQRADPSPVVPALPASETTSIPPDNGT